MLNCDMRRVRGFTLLEVLIVVIIIGVLASVAMPLFGRQIERARATEAVTALGFIRKAMEECYLARNLSYDGCDFLNYMEDPFAQPQSHFLLFNQWTPAEGGYLIVLDRNDYELSDTSPGDSLSVSCGINSVGTSSSRGLIMLCRMPDGTLFIEGTGFYEGMRW
jgi:prepilin-type N-terminal cleavage/methylation domain-containing protein